MGLRDLIKSIRKFDDEHQIGFHPNNGTPYISMGGKLEILENFRDMADLRGNYVTFQDLENLVIMGKLTKQETIFVIMTNGGRLPKDEDNLVEMVSEIAVRQPKLLTESPMK